jgi:hypothetical protein
MLPLNDSRRGKNSQLPLAGLLRQSVYSRTAGYGDVSDAERLSQNPAFRLIASERTWDRGAKLALGVGKRRLPEKKLSKAAIRRSEIGGL